MGNVLVIKNNDRTNKIHAYAEESLKYKKRKYYYASEGSENEARLKELQVHFPEGAGGYVLLVTYNGKNQNVIEDMFIGNQTFINEKYNVEYIMIIHLKDYKVIKSIIDKIDLDITKDFDSKCYVHMSNMESLYQELTERLMANAAQLLPNMSMPEKQPQQATGYYLHALAQKDGQALRIYDNGGIDAFRTEFQRDRERVVNCKAFRRLVDKAQIFSADKGDYFRTRMTHSLEVNQIAKAIAYALNLNLDLTEAIALGHDLGHTPFGHQGERTLDDILSGKIQSCIAAPEELLKCRCFGGFKHNYQSAKILTQLEEKYAGYPGLNVSVQVVEGVLKHTRLKLYQKDEIALEDFLSEDYLKQIAIDYSSEEQICSSLEGQVVAVADEIAQRGHDVDDALTFGVMSVEDFRDRLKIKKCSGLEKAINHEMEDIENTDRLIVDRKELQIARIVSGIVHYLIKETIEHSRKNMERFADREEITLENTTKMIEFPLDVEGVNSYLERVVQKKVICNSEVARADYNASMVVKALFEKYYSNPRLLHEGTIHKIFVETLMHRNRAVSNSAVNLSDGSIKLVNDEIREMTTEPLDENILIDYLNGVGGHENDRTVILFEKRKILIRAIVDYIAGMTDGYALEEYEKLK